MVSVSDESGVVRRERMAGVYRLSAYFLAVLTTEFPIVIISASMYVSMSYWMGNLMRTAVNFFATWFTFVWYAFANEVGIILG